MKVPATPQKIVFVIDDDASLRDSLSSLLRSIGLHVELFDSAAQFLKSKPPDVPSCLDLDVRLPGLSGLDFQAELIKSGVHVPIIFITGHGDIPMSVRAMKAGAIEFLTKPLREQDLLDAVQAGLDRDQARRESDKTVTEIRSKYDPADRTRAGRDRLCRIRADEQQIAGEIGISEITVKVHRGNLMRKWAPNRWPSWSGWSTRSVFTARKP
jgi:FixJ family two-component response regulator